MLTEHWNGSSWTPQTSIADPGASLLDVFATDANHVYVLGLGSAGVILKWNGTSWSKEYTTGFGDYPSSIWGTDSNHLFMVCTSGVIVKWDGTSWTRQSSGTTGWLNTMFGLDLHNIWVAGNDGIILRSAP